MNKWSLPATAKQKLAISRLACRLGIREPIEEAAMTRNEARALLYLLYRKVLGHA